MKKTLTFSTKELPAAERVNLAIENSYYKVHTVVMDLGTKACPWMFPFPEIVSGCGSREKLPEILKQKKITKVLIVTDPTVGKIHVPPIVEKIEAAGIQCEIFAQTEANPSVETVEAIKEKYISQNCTGFLAIGGGSPMDAAKIAAARVAKPKQDIIKMSGMMRILHKVPTIICVPTTAGTGSEVSIGAVISDHKTRHKYAITDPFITPKVAVLDPEVTVSMPPFITATTGVDALTHAVESYLTRAYNTNFTNKCCEDAIVDIFKYLDRAYKDSADIEARDKVLMASYKAGLAFTRTGVGYVHGIAHSMGGLYNTAHGLANAVILPIVLEEYGTCVHAKLAHLAEITGIKTDGKESEKAQAFIQAIRNMNECMGLPTGFDFIQKSDYKTIAKWSIHEVNINYPVPILYDKRQIFHILDRIIAEA